VTPGPLKRIGHVALGVPDVERALDFYVRGANLSLVERSGDGAYLRCQAEHHSLELHRSSEARLDHLAFETFCDEETEALRRRLERQGVPVAAAPLEPGRLGTAFRFQDPTGTWIEVHRGMARLPNLVSPGPFTVHRLGHVTMLTPDLNRSERFYREVVGFRLSDRREGFGIWLRCNADHHVLAFLASDRAALDHHAYEIPDWNEIKRVCDWCFRQGFPLDAGPMRHGPGNNVNVYVKDTDGVKIEFYAEMEQIHDDEDHVRTHPMSGARYGNLWQFKSSVASERVD
jgi:catechol 2,3-dioxygenase-like lactoylglutathione lyase family enzyme